ncbi:MAG TPA: cell division protein FtsL [Treponema sp.]|jgi:cell division protein FtsL|nr:cell division protein FtsL [Treponema sp.]
MKKGSRIVRVLFVALLALCIPGALAIGGMRSRKYADLNKDVTDLETRQQTLVDENKNLITDISLLSSTDRIERIAEEELGMRQAESEEIVRVQMKGANDE